MKPELDPKVEELLEFLGPLGSDVRGLFALMGVAEEELATAKKKHPLAEFAIQKAFSILAPDAKFFIKKHTELYRAHCRELLDRIIAGASKKELRLGTRAEVLSVMSGWSLEHPLGEQGAALFFTLFAEIFPERAENDGLIREPWPGSTEELLEALQRKIERSTSR